MHPKQDKSTLTSAWLVLSYAKAFHWKQLCNLGKKMHPAFGGRINIVSFPCADVKFLYFTLGTITRYTALFIPLKHTQRIMPDSILQIFYNSYIQLSMEESIMENKVLNDEMLEEASGGSFNELNDIRNFIKENDPDYKDKPLDQIIVADWLSTRLGMTLMRVKPSSSNQYVFDDSTMSHGELMTLLKTNYSAK